MSNEQWKIYIVQEMAHIAHCSLLIAHWAFGVRPPLVRGEGALESGFGGSLTLPWRLMLNPKAVHGRSLSRGLVRLIVLRVLVKVILGRRGIGAVIDQAQDPGLALSEQLQRLTHRAGRRVAAAHHEQRAVRLRREDG